MQSLLNNLKWVTKDCREDMHEPDEQGVDAIVTGNHLDNAFGEDQGPLPDTSKEYVVWLTKDRHNPIPFNLASLIALARKAVL